MLDKVLEKIVIQQFGDYIEGLQGKVKVGAWAGKVKIEELSLKQDVFLKMKLPFSISYSRIGSLRIYVPWNSLSSKPVEIELEQVYVILKPLEKSNFRGGAKGNGVLNLQAV